jgi:hypothetical protein
MGLAVAGDLDLEGSRRLRHQSRNERERRQQGLHLLILQQTESRGAR